jgi:DNA-binding MarR family transcriptional regulator
MSLPIPLFDIAQSSPAEIRKLFFLHRDLLKTLVEDLAAESQDSRAQHHLLVGGEGTGKSMLLARLGVELQRKGVGKKKGSDGPRLFPIYFSETALMLGRLSRFWWEILQALPADQETAVQETAAEKTGQPEKPKSLSEQEEEQLLRDLPCRIQERCARQNLRPVLLLEDFGAFLQGIGQQEHSLRARLLLPGAPILVATSRAGWAPDYQAAFFDHFKTHYLPNPSPEQGQKLLRHLAKARGNSRLLQALARLEPKVQALHALSQGNPRSLTRLFELYSRNPSGTIEEDLAFLLDRETPSQRGPLDALSDQARTVLHALASHWSPVGLGKLAQGCALPKGTVSSQLDRLRKAGLVQVRPLPGTSRKGYEIAPRRLALWLLTRNPLENGRGRLFAFARFLQDFLTAQKAWEAQKTKPPSRRRSTDPLPTLEALLLEKNWGKARARLKRHSPSPLAPNQLDPWLRILRASLQAGLGNDLADFWEQSAGQDDLRPWIAALRAAAQKKPELLQALPFEMRPCAAWLFQVLEDPS